AELNAGTEARKPVSLAEVQAQLAAEPVVARMETHTRADAAPAVELKAPVTLAEVSARIAAEPGPAAPEKVVETSDTIVADWRREIAAVGETAKAVSRPERVEPR
ncbi:DUF2497 domain-containing protein, partial [Mesorhizobium sp. M2D.F.Ca.ET.178.01.1.1]